MSDENWNDKQRKHIAAIHFYVYGGANDVKSLEDFTGEFDGDPDVYGQDHCPCPICLGLDW